MRHLSTPCVLRYQSPDVPPDEHNNPPDQFEDVESTCQFQQRARHESHVSGEVPETTWLVTLPPSVAAPVAADEIVVDGITYQFRGDAWMATSLSGRVDHIEATAMRAQ
jgi:hypothetical protein